MSVPVCMSVMCFRIFKRGERERDVLPTQCWICVCMCVCVCVCSSMREYIKRERDRQRKRKAKKTYHYYHQFHTQTWEIRPFLKHYSISQWLPSLHLQPCMSIYVRALKFWVCHHSGVIISNNYLEHFENTYATTTRLGNFSFDPPSSLMSSLDVMTYPAVPDVRE